MVIYSVLILRGFCVSSIRYVTGPAFLFLPEAVRERKKEKLRFLQMNAPGCRGDERLPPEVTSEGGTSCQLDRKCRRDGGGGSGGVGDRDWRRLRVCERNREREWVAATPRSAPAVLWTVCGRSGRGNPGPC